MPRLSWWRRRSAYRATFLEGDGREVLLDLCRFAGIWKSSARPDNTGRYDPYATAHAEGRREVALRVLSIMNLSDAEIRRLMEEETSE